MKRDYIAVSLKFQYRLLQKTQGVQVFAIAGQNTPIHSKSIPGVEVLMEVIEDFELETALLLAACMI